MRICKSWTFDAAHRLDRLPAEHKCHHLHGHTYRVEVELVGSPHASGPKAGMLIDYDDLDAIVAPVLALVDHKFLNDVPGLEVPTTELLAVWLLGKLSVPLTHMVDKVRVYESTTTWAEASRR